MVYYINDNVTYHHDYYYHYYYSYSSEAQDEASLGPAPGRVERAGPEARGQLSRPGLDEVLGEVVEGHGHVALVDELLDGLGRLRRCPWHVQMCPRHVQRAWSEPFSYVHVRRYVR